MQRLTVPYTLQIPFVELALAVPGNGQGIVIAGIVDSGADRTLLPRSIAISIGVPEEHLRETEHGSDGAGNTRFPTWELPYPIKGRVLAKFTPPRGIEPWGPELSLNPEFASDTVALFGRADFFPAFRITFEQAPASGRLHLDCED